MIDFYHLRKGLNNLRRNEGMIGGSLNLAALENKEKNVEAQISFKNFIINFNINPKLDELWNNDYKIKEYCKSKDITDIVTTSCEKILLHEIWHWKKEELLKKIGCPTDIINLGKNLDACYKALENKNFFKDVTDDKLKVLYAKDFANMFEDVLVNANLFYEDLFDGLSVVYYDMGKKSNSYPLLGEAFIKLQMKLMNSKIDEDLISNFYSKDKNQIREIETVIDKTLEEMTVKDLPLKNVVEKFRNIDLWANMAYVFTYNMCDLMEKNKDSSGQEGSSDKDEEDSEKEQEDKNKKGKGKKETKKEKGSFDSEENKEENKNDDEENNNGSFSEEKDQTMGLVKSLDDKLTEKEEKQIISHFASNGMGPPSFMSNEKVLKLNYDDLASEVVIKAKTKKEGFQMPLTPITHDLFDVKEHDFQEIDFSKPVVDLESRFDNNINFSVPDLQYTIESPYTKKKERLPDIMWLIDCSGSMADGGGNNILNDGKFWGEQSKYHYALLGLFGSIKWLKSQKIAPYLKYNVTMFSNATKTSGWNNYGQLSKSLDVCWTPQFGGTSIDLSVLESQLQKDPSVILFMSDGAIDNWERIKDSFRNLTEKHIVSYIQIKSKTQTGEDLAKWGKQVYTINKSEDLNDLIIDLTKQSYKKTKNF